MGEKVKLFSDLKIKQDSIFDFGELYQRLFSWFEVMGYEFHETGYEKHDQGGGANNLKIFWVATKDVDKYSRFTIQLNFFVMGLTKVEIEKEGLKIKTNKCGMEIRMTAFLEKDYGDKMAKSFFGPAGKNIYEKFIAKERLEDHEIRLYKETHLLIDEIKAFVSMHKF